MSIFDSNTYGFSHIDNEKSSYFWSIKNYSFNNTPRGEKLESPIFSSSDTDRQYCIAVWPNGTKSSTSDYIAMSFCNKCKFTIEVQFCISILDREGRKCHEKSKRNTIDSYDGFNDFLEKSLLETDGLLVNDVITFCCEYTIITGLLNSSSTVSLIPSLNLRAKTLDAFEQQLDTEEFSDFTLIAPCGKKLFVHKFILAARSPVFSAMFKNNMKENIDKTADIPDVDYDVLKEMLRFMYAAKVENLDNLAYDLVAAAEKYQIEGLKEFCEKYFFKNIKLENVKEILDLSCQYKLENLKDHIRKYVVCHVKSLIERVGFESDENMKILADTFFKLKFK